jgi:FixJ family two-component response regulator
MSQPAATYSSSTSGFTHARVAASSSDTIPIVFVVDDDLSVRRSLELLISSAGLHAETFASAADFLTSPRPCVANCLVLDVSLPGLDGLQLQERVAVERPDMPIIFITGHGDVPTSVRAMKAGAVEFLTKPFRHEALLRAIDNAIARSAAALSRDAAVGALRERYASLTVREQQVMSLVTRGRLNKQVGGDLGISEITVKAHRGSVMRKMRARTLPDLVDMAMTLGIRTRLIAGVNTIVQ